VVFSVCATFYGPGSQALLPEIVPRESIDRANGLFESSESIVGIAGSAAAGILVVVVGAVPSLGIDAASYFVGALLIALIGVSAAHPRPPVSAPTALGAEVREGLRYLARTTALLQLTIVGLVVNFLWSVVLTFLVVYTASVLHGSALVYGGLEAMLAAGWGVGGLVVGRLRLTRFTGRFAILTGFVEGGAMLGLVLTPSVPAALALILVVGVWQGVLNVTWLSTVQAGVPSELQGRYMSLDNAISYASIPLSQVVGGALIVSIGISSTFEAVGVGALIGSAGFLFLRGLGRLGYDPRDSRPPAIF
jgi:MFS transporter